MWLDRFDPAACRFLGLNIRQAEFYEERHSPCFDASCLSQSVYGAPKSLARDITFTYLQLLVIIISGFGFRSAIQTNIMDWMQVKIVGSRTDGGEDYECVGPACFRS